MPDWLIGILVLAGIAAALYFLGRPILRRIRSKRTPPKKHTQERLYFPQRIETRPQKHGHR